MRVNVTMPQLGESVAEGTILKWHKQVGDRVKKDEDILEISTDKVDSEIPAPVAGILVAILVQEGETIEVGKPIAVIETDVSLAAVAEKGLPALDKEEAGKEIQTASQVSGRAKPDKAFTAAMTALPGAQSARTEGKRFYSPLVRKIARQEGLDIAELDAIQGSGVGGRVTKKDLELYLEKRGKQPAAPPGIAKPQIEKPPVLFGKGEEVIPIDIMRQKIAEHMVKSAFTAPHVTSVSEADVTNIVSFRERVKNSFAEREGFKLTYTPIIIEATIKALKDYPYLNASLDGDNIILKHYVNIGVAVALENGLIVPVIKRADEMNLLALARAVNDLSVRARNKQLTPDEVHGSTFSITNPGIFGNLLGTPIINQPNVGILGLGAIVKRPVVVAGDAIAIRAMMYLSLSYDHRLIDGALGGQFLQRIVQYLETFDPETSI